jgi:hypothetical protein
MVQGAGDMSISLNEPVIEIIEAQKQLYFSFYYKLILVSDNRGFSRIYLYALIRDNKSQEYYLRDFKFALANINL